VLQAGEGSSAVDPVRRGEFGEARLRSLANATTVAYVRHMRTVGIAAAVVVVVALAAPAAHAEPLTPGVYLYQSNYGPKPRPRKPPNDARLMRVYVEYEEGAQALMLGIEGHTGAKCSKFPGRRTPVSYTVKKPRLEIRDDGSFASRWMKLASIPGYTGKIKLTGGTINSERVKGTLRLRMKIKSLGRCSEKHRFRVKIQASSNHPS
jgi:hypothetical protein